ncbi:alpha/beta fold hydrolase [Actinomadura decatromicini]|uniref:Alpha/beta hydrolase n=1 Tax=Actinomadura decatromicini TaxID=2604572 RepID=A0A5D3FNP0_9ACTN|nr:alpha/beta hydrolase [Actinomadura decatromicini]TYK49634.1 alpha/beta hydrolase [Actinomadura decatromicini]
MTEIVSAGGERVHVVESGPADGVPLLLGSGLGGAWFDWTPSVDLLRSEFRVIVHDRPGLGLSPAAARRPTLDRDARIMAALAERAGRPVIVLAHSMAAFAAEALARTSPEHVLGMVLVDPSFERAPRAPLPLGAALTPVCGAAGAVLDATRLARVAGPFGRRLALRHTSRRGEAVPDGVVRSVYGRGTVLGTVLAEEVAYREMAVALARLRSRTTFPAIPLVVLTALADAGRPAKQREWAEGHERLTKLSPLGSRVELPDARHMIALDHPDVIAKAVARVREEVP